MSTMPHALVDDAVQLIEAWLRRKARTESVLYALTGAGALVLSGFVLGITFGFSFAAIFIVFIKVGALFELSGIRTALPPTRVVLIADIIFLILLFYGNATTPRGYFSSLEKTNWRDSPWPGAVIRTTAELVTDVLYSGPRLVAAAFSYFARSFRLARLDAAACAQILVVLLNRNGRVSFIELARLFPGGNAVVVFPQLRDIEGVVFLIKDPAGLSLTADLRQELGRIYPDGWRHQHPGFEEAPPPEPEPEPAAPVEPAIQSDYEILGVTESASLAEIKAAYRRRMKECHPDRFVHLGEEMRQLAEERAKAVNAAYANLLERHGGERLRTAAQPN